MSASNHNYVCFRCRTVIRHPKQSSLFPRCLSCGAECYSLGYKVRIPSHSDVKTWQAIEKESQRRDIERSTTNTIRRVRRQHWLEQEIIRMRQMPLNRDRNRQIKKLVDELARIIRREVETPNPWWECT